MLWRAFHRNLVWCTPREVENIDTIVNGLMDCPGERIRREALVGVHRLIEAEGCLWRNGTQQFKDGDTVDVSDVVVHL
ncbi:hypothetical protein C441_10036 [Haloferax sulfurifontis ATCC BAA-897]|uniref:Uncharacterized protein n=1 Tax=Haloferax sulfurifontis ATCC BAA-897 TaxID=662480 RepID=M0ICN0_9EURY|nr:hypothetical protein C441_10036 [Haloferax sulfurifontis ATCC BAA-897]